MIYNLKNPMFLNIYILLENGIDKLKFSKRTYNNIQINCCIRYMIKENKLKELEEIITQYNFPFEAPIDMVFSLI